MSQFLNREQNQDDELNLEEENKQLKEENAALHQLLQTYSSEITNLEVQLAIYINREKA